MKRLAAIIVLFASAFEIQHVVAAPAIPVQRLAVPERGAYFGAFVDAGDTEDDVNLERVQRFEDLIGRHLAIVASSSYWGEGTFPTANLELIRRHGSVPLVFWSPWGKPYEQDSGPDKFSLDNILAGKFDVYIDHWADSARAYGTPFLVSLCNEMNGSWFPWSGYFYGAEKPLGGGKFAGPEKFKTAWRYIVDRVRARGAGNVLWVFHVNNYGVTNDAWNSYKQYYPGANYVDWLGASVYGMQFRNRHDHWVDFDDDLLDEPYRWLAALDPQKPIMVAEFGVGEFPEQGNKAQWFAHAFASIEKRFPRIKAAVYWNERWQNEDGTYSNLRVNTSAESLQAFREGVDRPFWLGEPLWQPQARVAAKRP
ncbi:MAG: glycoside hydrolase family 26 protein [Chthoniobacterales bacterium]